MAFRELLFISTRALRAHPLRSTLTMLGLSIGVAAGGCPAPGGRGLIQTLSVGGITGFNPPQTVFHLPNPIRSFRAFMFGSPQLYLSRREDHLVSEHAATADTLDT
jgi:hypothetical protein